MERHLIMEILTFINSKDVREYLCNVDYKFNAVEAAWIVNQCAFKSLKEKLDAWRWITNHMEDCEVEVSPHRKINSLHEKLETTIEYFKGGDVYLKLYDTEDFTEGDKKNSIYWLDEIWLYFPVPFKKGDIVINSIRADRKDFGRYNMGPFVFMEATGNERRGADSSDMNGYGYFQLDDDAVYYESMWTYMDLEYYRGELTGQERFLYALSNYFKGKMGDDLALLLASHRAYIMINYQRKWDESFLNFYTEEGLRLAGLK